MTDVVRSVTDDEVAAFHEQGWVVLRQLVRPEAVERLRSKVDLAPGAGPRSAIDELRSEGRAAVHAGEDPAAALDPAALPFEYRGGLAEEDDDFAAIALGDAMGANASRLILGQPRVRLEHNDLVIKHPTAPATGWHQDLAWKPYDRSLAVNFWIALIDVPAELGALRFISGSHRYGLLGRAFTTATDYLDEHPWLKELEVSPELELAAGDATVHHGLTVHSAPRNRGTTPRVAYSCFYFDAATLYTGAPHENNSSLGLQIDRPFDHPLFPIVGR